MAIATALAAPAATAMAQDASNELMLEEVLVTATKRTTNLMDIPQSIQAISEMQIRQAGLYSLDDYARFIPSMSYVSLVPGQAKIFFRGIATHVVLEPLDFIARLAALVPRPRLNLTRFHGVFAPNFKHRDRIVPQRAQRAVEGDKPVAPMSWMQRLKRVFAIDIETCPECGGRLRVIACIEDPPLIAKILGHVRRREVLIGNTPRSPPVLQPELTLT